MADLPISARRRVLVIASWYPSIDSPTAGVFIQQQVLALSAVADVAVLHVEWGPSSFAPVLSIEDGVTVVRAGVRDTGLVSRFLGYRRVGRVAFRALRQSWGDPEIVHVQALFPAAMIARDIKRRLKVPYVVTEHSEEYLAFSKRRLVRTPGMLPLILRPLALGASRTIAVSELLSSRLRRLRLTVDPVVIPNVVPLAPATVAATEPPHVIAHVSIMGPAKNLDMLLRAIDLLRESRTDFVLKLAGDGECRQSLERLSGKLGLGEFVQFAGRKSLDEVHSLLASAAFSVISSTHETFSVAAAESLMCGRPVLSTRCGGPEEFLTPELGRIVESDNVTEMANGLDWMLDHCSEFEPQALHEYARERFSPEVVAAQVLGIYSSVLDADDPRAPEATTDNGTSESESS